MTHDSPSRLDPIVARMGFAIDDYDAANEVFDRWRSGRDDADLERAQAWAYAYVDRYFTARFATERAGGASDLDALVTKALRRIYNAFDRITGPFAHYVSVACRNTLLNHRRDRKVTVEVHEDTATAQPTEADAYDRRLARRVVEAAFAGLPDAIGEVGRLRYLEARDYQEVAEITGRPVATVRSFAAKVRARLSDHPELRALHYDDVVPVGALPAS